MIGKNLKMPVARDITVHREAAQNEEPSPVASVASANLVTVMGFDKKDVLFRSDKVGTVQWRDSTGAIVALLVRIKPDIFGFSRAGDDDWEEVLKIYGNPDEGN